MAKKTTSTSDYLKFRGLPITGDAKTFVGLLEKKFGFQDWGFKETSVELYAGQFVGEDVNLHIYYSQKSKTVHSIDIFFINLNYEDEYTHYKNLYAQKYGEPQEIIDPEGYEETQAVFEIPGGRITIHDDFYIKYTNTINEELANREHDMALLDEI